MSGVRLVNQASKAKQVSLESRVYPVNKAHKVQLDPPDK